jgi:hypothetical protein
MEQSGRASKSRNGEFPNRYRVTGNPEIGRVTENAEVSTGTIANIRAFANASVRIVRFGAPSRSSKTLDLDATPALAAIHSFVLNP